MSKLSLHTELHDDIIMYLSYNFDNVDSISKKVMKYVHDNDNIKPKKEFIFYYERSYSDDT